MYDSSISAREYLSYIAEQAGGFACIGRDGKLYIKTIGQDTAEVNIELFQDYSWGEIFQVSRVAYENGVQDFKFGDETNNTIWINPDNMYIVDENQIKNMYDQLNSFACYSFEGTTIIDPALDVGDIIIINHKRVIYQGDLEYVGKFKVSISSKIQAKSKEETTRTVISDKTKIRRVQSQIDQVEGIITQLVQETKEYEDKFTQVQQNVDSIKQNVGDIVDYKRVVEGATEVHLINSAELEVLKLNMEGNKTYNHYLYPSSDLYLMEYLYPDINKYL